MANPGPFAMSASRVRTNNAASTTSVNVKAICAVTITFRSRTLAERRAASLPERRRQRTPAGLPGGSETAAETRDHTGRKGKEQQGRVDSGVQVHWPRCRAGGRRSELARRPERRRSRAIRPRARSAGCQPEADVPGVRAKRPGPAACRSRDRGPMPRARNRPETFKQARPSSTAVTANSTHRGSARRRRSPEWPCGAAVNVERRIEECAPALRGDYREIQRGACPPAASP